MVSKHVFVPAVCWEKDKINVGIFRNGKLRKSNQVLTYSTATFFADASTTRIINMAIKQKLGTNVFRDKGINKAQVLKK